VNAQSCIQQWLHRLTRKLDATIVLYLYVFIGLTLRLLLRATLLIALGNFLARGLQVTLVLSVVGVVEPEADIFCIEVVAGRVQRVNQTLFQIFKVRLLADLRPPIFEHSLIKITGDQELTVQEGDFELLESYVDARVESRLLSAPVALDLITAVSLDEKVPQLLVADIHINTRVFTLLYIRVNVLCLLSLDGVGTVQVLTLRVFLA
jgi:hypothetical protein